MSDNCHAIYLKAKATARYIPYELTHLAEDILMDTGCIMPLYFYTDVFMINAGVQGFFTNPLGYRYSCTAPWAEQQPENRYRAKEGL